MLFELRHTCARAAGRDQHALLSRLFLAQISMSLVMLRVPPQCCLLFSAIACCCLSVFLHAALLCRTCPSDSRVLWFFRSAFLSMVVQPTTGGCAGRRPLTVEQREARNQLRTLLWALRVQGMKGFRRQRGLNSSLFEYFSRRARSRTHTHMHARTHEPQADLTVFLYEE